MRYNQSSYQTIIIPILTKYGTSLQAGSKLITYGFLSVSCNVETSLETNDVFPAPAIPSTIIHGIFFSSLVVDIKAEAILVSSILPKLSLVRIQIFIKLKILEIIDLLFNFM